ncbi:2',3'-cyclic-nucleotide 2'-phosphodiesterase (5'-nucleotidase family) [Pullulanibacillus pueri]|uniref:Putative metallophosphoesterase YunD n=1 Tax=Pullulanibacillus pueri TaxID=1437324 RepID=A0A8J2ZVF3_9BACL|nr:5'-nucleotidase C-terminal domain-containing protein [Pullulanibacillus pueri]MBM7680894.1 2',3'-cyclic-nucleotide 2'-phosphodiesterase (5'-nucleotidase family) [Pullulanibacillus pueri]GGH81238.1 putative metallophosphoesterase YunD [Pullulanibacillus pueri]
MKLTIIHTNDLHSHFENFARVATLIQDLKDEHTLVLDGGDFADFKSIELQGTRGMAAIELLEAVGYDALTIGNNEMFNGVDTLELMASQSPMPFMSNNLFKKDQTKINGVFSSTIIEKSGLRIFITGSSPDLGEFNEGLGIQITDYKKALVHELERCKGQYDLCIILNHVGTFADNELAEALTGIDVIISAHDHQLYPEAKVIGETILNSAGCYGEYIGLLELEIENGHVKLLDSKTIATADIPISEQVTSIVKKNKEKAIEVLSQPLYSIQEPLWHDVINENPLTNLIADGLKDMLNCDIGLINSGIVNAGVSDYLTQKKLIEICPSPLNPTAFEIQGKYIKQALEESLDVQLCLSEGRGAGFRGKYVGRLHVSGATIVHDGKTLSEILIGSTPLDEEKWYSVATSDYLQRGSGYECLANNRNETYRPEEIREVIRMYANQDEFLKKAFTNRWKENSPVIL